MFVACVQYSIVQYSMVWYGMVQYSIVQYNIAQYSIAQYSIIYESKVRQLIVCLFSEGGMMRLEALIELNFIDLSFSSLSSYRNQTNRSGLSFRAYRAFRGLSFRAYLLIEISLSSNSRQQYSISVNRPLHGGARARRFVFVQYIYIYIYIYICIISLLALSLLTLLDSNFPGNPPWTWEFHPSQLILCLSQTLRDPECQQGDWPYHYQFWSSIIIISSSSSSTTIPITTILLLIIITLIFIFIIVIVEMYLMLKPLRVRQTKCRTSVGYITRQMLQELVGMNDCSITKGALEYRACPLVFHGNLPDQTGETGFPTNTYENLQDIKQEPQHNKH